MKVEAIPYIISDQFLFPPGTSSHVFGGDTNIEKKNSISEMSEKKYIDWIFKNPHRKSLFLEEITKGISKHNIRKGILRRKIIEDYDGGGDFDLIVLDGDNYTRATSIEFKRFTTRREMDGREIVRKLDEMSVLKQQGEDRLKFGFHKVILLAAIEVDSSELRSDDGTNPTPFNLSWHKLNRLYDSEISKMVPKDVGFGIVEACQYSRKDYNQAFGFGVKLIRIPKEKEQDSKISESIKKNFQIRNSVTI